MVYDIKTKWSDLSYDDFYIPYDENQKAIRGFWLTTLNIDLEKIPSVFFEDFNYFEKQHKKENYEIRKVYVSDIVGSSYADYSGKNLVQAYMKIKRADNYIKSGIVTRGKYFNMLKKSIDKQSCPIILSQNTDETYFVDGNGNHRVVLYKMMMLSEIAKSMHYEDDVYFNRKELLNIRNKYWLNVKINI